MACVKYVILRSRKYQEEHLGAQSRQLSKGRKMGGGGGKRKILYYEQRYTCAFFLVCLLFRSREQARLEADKQEQKARKQDIIDEVSPWLNY